MTSVTSIPPPPIVSMQADFLHVLNFLYLFTVHQAKSTGYTIVSNKGFNIHAHVYTERNSLIV